MVSCTLLFGSSYTVTKTTKENAKRIKTTTQLPEVATSKLISSEVTTQRTSPLWICDGLSSSYTVNITPGNAKRIKKDYPINRSSDLQIEIK